MADVSEKRSTDGEYLSADYCDALVSGTVLK
jgi:hypothetical protein